MCVNLYLQLRTRETSRGREYPSLLCLRVNFPHFAAVPAAAARSVWVSTTSPLITSISTLILNSGMLFRTPVNDDEHYSAILFQRIHLPMKWVPMPGSLWWKSHKCSLLTNNLWIQRKFPKGDVYCSYYIGSHLVEQKCNYLMLPMIICKLMQPMALWRMQQSDVTICFTVYCVALYRTQVIQSSQHLKWKVLMCFQHFIVVFHNHSFLLSFKEIK